MESWVVLDSPLPWLSVVNGGSVVVAVVVGLTAVGTVEVESLRIVSVEGPTLLVLGLTPVELTGAELAAAPLVESEGNVETLDVVSVVMAPLLSSAVEQALAARKSVETLR